MSLNLSERQQQVLQCVKDAKAENKRPYTAGVVNRMQKKGHEITEKQCAYDLGVIIRTKGTGVISFKPTGKPTMLISNMTAHELEQDLGDRLWSRFQHDGLDVVECNWADERVGGGV